MLPDLHGHFCYNWLGSVIRLTFNINYFYLFEAVLGIIFRELFAAL